MKPKPFEKTFTLKAARKRVFEALASADQLRQWFAQHVRVEPRVGGAYQFWGRHTFLMPRQSDATQRITRIESSAALAFEWTWAGAPGRVALELTEAAGRTSMRVAHEMDAELPGFEGDTHFLCADFWGIAAGNLRCFLATGRPALRPDYSAPTGPVVMSVEIDALPAAVMRALTDPVEMNKWIAHNAVVELRPGGQYSYGWTTQKAGANVPAGPFKIVEFEPGRLLVHDWEFHAEGLTRVRWELKETVPGRTLVTLTHERFDEAKRWGGYVQGWANYLAELKYFVQGEDAA